MAIEIVSFPNYKMMDRSIVFCMFTRGYTTWFGSYSYQTVSHIYIYIYISQLMDYGFMGYLITITHMIQTFVAGCCEISHDMDVNGQQLRSHHV